MHPKHFFALGALFLSACAIPDTPMWNDREAAASVRMPAELITKVGVLGTAKSLVSNPVSGTHKGVSMWWRRTHLLSDSILEQRPLLATAYEDGTDIEHALDLLDLPRPLPGKIDYLIDGDEFFPAIEKSIAGAQKRVDTQVFIFDNDDVATRYADLLRARSKDVKCRVLMDRMGSITSWWTPPGTKMPQGFVAPASMPHYLRDGSKVKVRESQNPWLVADHAKLMLIDGKEAYLGGMNIGREYRYEWHDMMVRLTGPITTKLQNNFDSAWRLQGFWGDWSVPFHKPRRVLKTSDDPSHYPIRILRTTPSRTEIEEALLVAIRMSRKRIYLQNSYVTSKDLLLELMAACKRGVEVHFIFPIENDSALMDSATEKFAADLLEAGGKVYAYPRFTHLKAILVDDWACLGSANLDGLSMRINNELNIAFSDPQAVETLRRRVFLKDIRQSRRLRYGEVQDRLNLIQESLLQQL